MVSVDDADLARHAWYLGSNGYFMRYIGGGRKAAKQQTLHREIMLRLGPAKAGHYIDHINHDRLDCRRENLRWVTPVQSAWHKVGLKARSGYKGVYPVSGYTDRFAAGITVNHRKRHLGVFTSVVDAAKAYDKAAREFGGAYAYLNFPDDHA